MPWEPKRQKGKSALMVPVVVTRLVLGGKRHLPRPGCYSALLGLGRAGGPATAGGFSAVSNFSVAFSAQSNS